MSGNNETTIPIDMDPAKILASLDQISRETKALASVVEEQMGRRAGQALKKFEDDAEKGTTRVSMFFRNLGSRVKEDLKTAFDATGVLAGTKLTKDLGEGVRSVFEMERAFDRLNTRLGLSTKALADFKRQVGSRVAGTGQKLEDVLPGVESAASKGGITDTKSLSGIGEALGRVRATTGEDTAHLSDTVIEVMKKQGMAMTGGNFQRTLDAFQGTRTAGAFKSAGEAGGGIEELAGFAQKLHLNTRQLGGLAAMASKSGDSGHDILKQIIETGTNGRGGDKQINATFGAQLFKNGKLDVNAFSKVNANRFGDSAIMGQASGIQGANGEDLKRFIASFKSGTADFTKVTQGANETADQFATATDNLASQVDQFKEKAKEASRELGSSISKFGHDLLTGSSKDLGQDAKDVAKSAWDNKGSLAGAGAVSIGAGLLLGGGLNGLLGKVPGGKLAGGLVGGGLAKAAGATPVFVVNAADIGGGSGALGAAAGGMGNLGKIAGGVGGVVAAGAIGVIVGEAINAGFEKLVGKSIGEKAYDWTGGSSSEQAAAGTKQLEKNRSDYNSRTGSHLSFDEYVAAIKAGTLAAHKEGQTINTGLINPSAIHGSNRH